MAFALGFVVDLFRVPSIRRERDRQAAQERALMDERADARVSRGRSKDQLDALFARALELRIDGGTATERRKLGMEVALWVAIHRDLAQSEQFMEGTSVDDSIEPLIKWLASELREF